MKDSLTLLEEQLPPIIPRHKIRQFLGDLYSPAYLANLDSRGSGPEDRIIVGKKVCYSRASLVKWLRARTTGVESEAAR